MSLAPAERKALARIEDSLRRSDPRLASMLTRFGPPHSGGGWAGLARRLPRLRPFIPLMIALVAVLLFILGTVFSTGKPWRCGVGGRAGSAAAARVVSQVSGCPSVSGGGYTGDGATGNIGSFGR